MLKTKAFIRFENMKMQDQSFPDIKGEALHLLNELQVDDPRLSEVYQILSNQNGTWWDNLSDEEKASVAEGEADIAAGRVISHQDLMAEARTWIRK